MRTGYSMINFLLQRFFPRFTITMYNPAYPEINSLNIPDRFDLGDINY
jgi:hypothetical protein